MSRIKVYQPLNPTFMVDESVEHYDPADFKKVWVREYPMADLKNEADIEALREAVFEWSNRGNKPEGWSGHSMSVGDIIDINHTKFICCNFGWKQVEWKEA